jgi:hypothetical protein
MADSRKSLGESLGDKGFKAVLSLPTRERGLKHGFSSVADKPIVATRGKNAVKQENI